MKATVGNNPIGPNIPEPISTVLALGIFAIAMWFTGGLMSLINPWYSVGYYGASILSVIGMILYPILYFARYK
jgi:hypothetical protein